MTGVGPAYPFGRVPRSVVLVAVLLGVAGFFSAVSCVTPWFSESGTIPGHPFHSAFTLDFAPGPNGYLISCVIVVTTSSCFTTAYDYSAGSGTALLTGLYVGLLAAMIVAGVLAFVSVGLIIAGFFDKIRVRRARQLAVTLLLVALLAGGISAAAFPALQSPALSASHACGGFNGSSSPCNSLAGAVSGVGCQGGTCAETNVTWSPAEGWYFALAATGLIAGALLVLRTWPLGAPCGACGAENSFREEYCRACSNPLPVRRKKPRRATGP